jgi:hypothetical protein
MNNFKVGDWVRTIEGLFYITNIEKDTIHLSNGEITTADYISDLEKGDTFYFISPEGKVEDVIIYSGISPNAFKTLSKVFTIYTKWKEAQDALIEFNSVFTYFRHKGA